VIRKAGAEGPAADENATSEEATASENMGE
jgi:hypothetical protein